MHENNSTKKLEIPLTIVTEFDEPASEYEAKRLRLDYASFYLGSILYFIKMTARAHSMIDISVDGPPLLEINQFAIELDKLCELAEAINHTIECPPLPAAFRDVARPSLAELISTVMNHPDIPTSLYDEFGEALCEIKNCGPRTKQAYNDGPEEIAAIIQDAEAIDRGEYEKRRTHFRDAVNAGGAE